jgi:AP2-associated kinase
VPQKYTIRGKQIQELKLLSEGSFGFIWLAEDTATKQKYALKRIVCITNDRLLLARNELEVMVFPRPYSKDSQRASTWSVVSVVS